MNGDSETGVTIIYMVKKMDAGAMLAQAKMPIEENDDTATVFQKMSILGRDTLLETIPKILDGTIESIEQDEERVVFLRPSSRKKKNCRLNQPLASLIGKSGRCDRVLVLILLIFWASARNFGIFPFWMKKLLCQRDGR